MYLQLFLLFISFCTYAADKAPITAGQPTAVATYQNSNGIENITYTRGDVTVTFPAEILLKSDTISDLLANCSQDVQKDRGQTLAQAAQWLLDNVDSAILCLYIETLKIPQQKFSSELRRLVAINAPESIDQFLTFLDEFHIKSIYDPLITEIAQCPYLWPYMPDNYDIIQQISPEITDNIGRFLNTAYKNIGIADYDPKIKSLPLSYIAELVRAFKSSWDHAQPYEIRDAKQLRLFKNMIPELLSDRHTFTNREENFKDILKQLAPCNENDELELAYPTLQFLCIALEHVYKKQAPYTLRTQNDLHHCFTFNQELNKHKHVNLARELRSNNLFEISDATQNTVRKEYIAKISQRLRAKKILQRSQFSLLDTLSTKQLNMLFRASYQPYRINPYELQTYCPLPSILKSEKLFDQTTTPNSWVNIQANISHRTNQFVSMIYY